MFNGSYFRIYDKNANEIINEELIKHVGYNNGDLIFACDYKTISFNKDD